MLGFMQTTVAIFAMLSVLGVQPAANGQEVDLPVESQEVVVTGTAETRQAIAHYVDGVTAEYQGQLATLRQPICPEAIGLPEAYNRVIEARLRQVGAQIGLQGAVGDCDINLIVMVADSSGTLLERLRKVRPQVFLGVEWSELSEILRSNAPVRTWQSIEPRGADGSALDNVSFIDLGNGPRYVGNSFVLRGPSSISSRITSPVRQDLVSSFIVFDIDAIDGLTLTQVADYAAMRLFARTRTPAHFPGASILKMFNRASGETAVSELTRWDIAYLRALYGTSNSRAANLQKAAIRGALERALEPVAGK
jgi:hypothetical protein